MAMDPCKSEKKSPVLSSFQQSFRIDDLLRHKVIEQQPGHFPIPSHNDRFDENDTFRIGPVPPPKAAKPSTAVSLHSVETLT